MHDQKNDQNLTKMIFLTFLFSEQVATLTLNNLTLEDDDMEIRCEVHWNTRYGSDTQAVNVYGRLKTPRFSLKLKDKSTIVP